MLTLANGLTGLRKANDEQAFEVTLVTQTAAGTYDDSKLSFRVIRRPGMKEFWNLIRAADIVHVAGPALAPILLGRIAGKPVVVEHHGFHAICPNGHLLIEPAVVQCPGHFMAGRHSECLRCNASQGWLASQKLWLLTFVRHFLCKGVAANIVPTRWVGRQMDLPRTEAIFHGLESRPIVPSLPPQAKRPVIAFVGRLVTNKGVRLLFEAARILCEENRTFELLIIGDGPDRPTLEEFARHTQLSELVRFAGKLVGAEQQAALKESLAVVVPSIGGETFGLVIAENMQRGLPVVASDLGVFAEVLGGTGILFQTGNAADLAAKLGHLLDDPETAKHLGQNARQRAEYVFSLREMLVAHAELYERLLNRIAELQGSF